MQALLMADEKLTLIHGDHNVRHQVNSTTYHEDRCHSAEQRSRRTKYLVVLCILFVELCERLTFYGVASNLIFYCKDALKLASPLPSTIALAFQGQ